MKRMKFKSILSLVGLFTVLSSAATLAYQNQGSENLIGKADYKMGKSGFSSMVFGQNKDGDGLKVHFKSSVAYAVAVEKAADLIAAKIEGDMDRHVSENHKEEVHNKFIKRKKQYGMYLKTAFGSNSTDILKDKKGHIKIDRKLLLLDIDVFNEGEDDLVVDRDFIRGQFKSEIAFWFDENASVVKKGDSSRIVVVIMKEQLFDVQKKNGGTQLNYNTKSDLNK